MGLADTLRLALPFDLGYERERDLIQRGDPAIRRRVAARRDAHPEVLYFLATDEDPSVRRAAASNPETPPQADLVLSKDGDGEVRLHLAEKIARLVPDLGSEARRKVEDSIADVIDVLARDETIRVRAVLADALKDVADVPERVASVIRDLAGDREISVAGPIVEFSPLLSDDDLLALILSAPSAGVLGRIAKRRNLSEPVSDKIVETGDEVAVAALLANDSAQIREETLDLIVDGAERIFAWHAPLARRPRLPGETMVRLARFVSTNLLEELRRRTDMDGAIMAKLAAAVEQRLDRRNAANGAAAPAAAEDGGRETAGERARRLFEKGALDEETILHATGRREKSFVEEALALRAGLSVAVVGKILASGSARGITALVWKAGLSMPLALALQLQIGRVPSSQALRPRDGTRFPMTEDELSWQLSFFEGMGAPG